MRSKIRIVQNCFHENQIPGCQFEPYLNRLPILADESHLFFESDVISKLVRGHWHAECDFFGVLGYRWNEKLNEAKSKERSLPIRNLSKDLLSKEHVERFVERNSDADFLSLGRFIPHSVFLLGDKLHPGLLHTTGRLLEAIGVRFNLKRIIRQPIYFNSFIARSASIESYVNEILHPVIQAAINDPNLRALCFQDAGYFRKFRPELERLYGISYYPLHPFIGERLVNIYTMLAGSKIVSFDQNSSQCGVSSMTSSIEFCMRSTCWNWFTLRAWRLRM